MEMEDDGRKLLCFKDGMRIYAVDFQDVAEICINVRLRFIPSLPDYFCGVFYYSGCVVPVVMIGKGEMRELSTVLVVQYEKGLFGILLYSAPWAENVLPEERTLGDYKDLMEGHWVVEEIYRKADQMIIHLNIEKSAEELTVCRS